MVNGRAVHVLVMSASPKLLGSVQPLLARELPRLLRDLDVRTRGAPRTKIFNESTLIPVP